MNTKKIFIYKNDTPLSLYAYTVLVETLKPYGYEIYDTCAPEVDLVACIGGDGTFLKFLHDCAFPDKPVIGINTGHLGFFQELMPDEIQAFVDSFENGDYKLQTLHPVEAYVYTNNGTFHHLALNEIIVRGSFSQLVHFRIVIDQTIIQNFSGDGVLVASPVGSTAYNYSLGGSLVSPELDVLQLTPIAPNNTNAYRSFRSSIIIPASKKIILETNENTRSEHFSISYDGHLSEYSNIKKVEILQSEKQIRLVRFESYDYWSKLKEKLL